MVTQAEPLYINLSADDPDLGTTEIESLCMNCLENGITRLLLTKIPFYKEVVLMSFSCEHCGFQNNEIQSGAEIQEKGIKLKLVVSNAKDMNRRVVKSDSCSVRIEELDFEVPAKTQKGEVTTVEGIIMRCVTGLTQDQVLRRIEHPEAAEQIDQFIIKLENLKTLEKPFTLIIDDMSGDAHIENPNAPNTDHQLTSHYYTRTKEQNHLLGIFTHEEIDKTTPEEDKKIASDIQDENNEMMKPIAEGAWPLEELHGEVLQFHTLCSNCGANCETNMKVTSIPHFKDIVLMATVCDECGTRTTEVKGGGGIEEKGVRIEVIVNGREDFSRDVLKSENCHVELRELDVEVGPSTLGGRFTTVEGLLTAMRDQLSQNSAMFSDSSDRESQDRLKSFLDKFQEVLDGTRKITVILDDPTGNSYVQSLVDDGEVDPNLRIFRYHRSYDQNEELGLNDMITEGYEQNEDEDETTSETKDS
ncbi:unnamed protein product [Diamesa serratosioi]